VSFHHLFAVNYQTEIKFPSHVKPARAEAALKQTLHDLGVEYLDLYLMHWPVSTDPKSGKIELEFVDVRSFAGLFLM
jgi:diketogulonate reductase-like aldo/keto reductase